MFGIQVKVNGVWCFMCPSFGKPYQYPTQDEASRMMHICYPDQIREHRLGGEGVVRVKEFDNAIPNQD